MLLITIESCPSFHKSPIAKPRAEEAALMPGPAFAVEVPDRGTHASLLATVFVERNARHHRDIGKSSIPIIVIKNAWRTITGYVNIRPSVVIIIKRGNAERVVSFGPINASLGCDVHESTVTTV